MSKYFFPVILLLFAAILFFFHTHSLNLALEKETAEVHLLTQRISSLQSSIVDTSIYDKEQLLAIKALHQEIKGLHLKIQQVEVNLKRDYGAPLALGIPITFFALIGFGYSLYRFAYNSAIKAAEIEMKKYFTPIEEQIVENSRLLLLTPSGKTDKKLHKLLRNSGFEKIKLKTVEQKKLPSSLDDFDVLIFNDFEDTTIIENIVQDYPDKAILYYGTGILKDTTNPSISSARFLSQVYGNLMNLLKYQRSARQHRSIT
ncbi:NARF domain-containing protein [Lewinella sp. LCG006]|uniref:NARF domain-containing protein n=1 Tax=Lewinella sp. LCG006 TaxID=3231911 RepID=UPI00345F5EAB